VSVYQKRIRDAAESGVPLGEFDRALLKRARQRKEAWADEVAALLLRVPERDITTAALEHANAFANALHEAGAKFHFNVWVRPGVGARVYLGNGFLSFGWDGSVSTTLRGESTFETSSLYPDQRRTYAKAMKLYFSKLAGR